MLSLSISLPFALVVLHYLGRMQEPQNDESVSITEQL
jgi:hypothetical protein